MFGNKRRRELKSAAGEATRLLLELDRTLRDTPAPGYSRNAFGDYWNDAVLEDWLKAKRNLVGLMTDIHEKRAAKYSIAATLRIALRLDEAVELCNELIEEYPQTACASWNLLAYIAARRGNVEKARELAAIIRNDPNPTTAFFRLREEDIQREYADGLADASVDLERSR
jgi:tetratricopeptide (TPR) repeat protein